MRIGEQIKNYRKTEGLTQEQVANYLGVSTPAVNKWEKGNTYPDISLLPALARLLKIDMNELFSFREELTEKEIGQFVNELSEVSLDSFTEAFEMASRKGVSSLRLINIYDRNRSERIFDFVRS